MCDTLIATKLATSNGVPIFGKNSDRPPNESQYIAYFPAATHAPNSRLQCTYIEIPQAEKTNAVLLSMPFWMWGAEMGVNEHGLTIGNEAVFSKIPANKKPALLGMDMIRIALERTSTAREALQLIVDLLEEYGQGGNCVHEGESYYHNSFIIADPNDAWVLETVDRQWIARQVKDVYSISNCLTIRDHYDMASKGLVETAAQKGWIKSPQEFDFSKNYSDFLYTTFAKGHQRRATTFDTLEKEQGAVTVQTMMGLLRDHKSNPQKGILDIDVCWHAGWGPVRISQTTASMVVLLDGNRPIVFATGTAAPCTSIFKPMWLDAALDASHPLTTSLGPVPGSTYDSESLFWCHEKLHRATMQNYEERIKVYSGQRDELEAKFVQGALALAHASSEERAAYSARCLRDAQQAEADWLAQVEKVPARKTINNNAWQKFNQAAKMPSL